MTFLIKGKSIDVRMTFNDGLEDDVRTFYFNTPRDFLGGYSKLMLMQEGLVRDTIRVDVSFLVQVNFHGHGQDERKSMEAY